MTAEDFADVLGKGEYERGNEYGPNKDGVIGWRGGVRRGEDFFQYTVHDRDSPVEPSEVMDAIRYATRIKQGDDGDIFWATVWRGNRCYMLWHKRKKRSAA